MRETVGYVKSIYDAYTGAGMHMALFFASILYLILQKKDREKRYFFLGYALLFFIICFFPVTAEIIMYCIGKSVYWRIFWLLPTSIVIAYAAVLILMEIEKKWKRYVMIGFMAVIIYMSGTIVYNASTFDYKQNHYNIPQDVVDICDIIERDAEENGIEEKKLIIQNELLSYVRQYDADIKMPYGYNAVKGLEIDGTGANEIFNIMSGEDKNMEALSYYAVMEGCNYLAYQTDGGMAAKAAEYGYVKVGSNASYSVYRQTLKKESQHDNWVITQHGSPQGAHLMFYTLTDMEGHLIVIDGGWRSDAEYVRQELKKLGNHVDAWFVTHPHRDHAGAFYEIYKDPGKLKIDKVYMVDMAPIDLCLSNAPWDEVEVYEQLLTLDIPELTYVHAGDEFEAAGLKIEVFNAYDDYVDDLSDDLLNDGSMMFKVSGKTESMLFCSDVGKKMSDYLLEKYGDRLQADYIQMGHHGNGGLKSDFYKSIGAKAAFFDAPDKLMYDTTGQYTTIENISLMAGQDAKIYSFSTCPNRVVLR